jgi:hypothetical protein
MARRMAWGARTARPYFVLITILICMACTAMPSSVCCFIGIEELQCVDKKIWDTVCSCRMMCESNFNHRLWAHCAQVVEKMILLEVDILCPIRLCCWKIIQMGKMVTSVILVIVTSMTCVAWLCYEFSRHIIASIYCRFDCLWEKFWAWIILVKFSLGTQTGMKVFQI